MSFLVVNLPTVLYSFRNLMEYLQALYAAEPVYFLVGGISTVTFLLKLALLGLSGISKDLDLDSDSDNHLGAEASFKLFTTQTLLVFLMGMGWLGLAVRTELKLSHALAAAVALGFGFSMMMLAAFLAKHLTRLNQIPTFNRWSLVGTRGRVYLTVPPRGRGEGEVEVILGGGKKILKATNESAAEIPSFTEVTVTGIEGKHLVVKKAE
ncbi:MAG: NfeD family protein [Oligoflexia bacterium]|nr:NfeD family protein [Oligoflexia bacterium]